MAGKKRCEKNVFWDHRETGLEFNILLSQRSSQCVDKHRNPLYRIHVYPLFHHGPQDNTREVAHNYLPARSSTSAQ